MRPHALRRDVFSLVDSQPQSVAIEREGGRNVRHSYANVVDTWRHGFSTRNGLVANRSGDDGVSRGVGIGLVCRDALHYALELAGSKDVPLGILQQSLRHELAQAPFRARAAPAVPRSRRMLSEPIDRLEQLGDAGPGGRFRLEDRRPPFLRFVRMQRQYRFN